MNKIFINISLALTLLLLITSCEKEKNEPDVLPTQDSIYWFVDGLMDYWYYWNNELPDLDYLSYDAPQDLMSDLMVEQDRWSFVDKAQVVDAYFNAGEEFGYGFYLGWDRQYNLRVFLAYKNSTAYTEGVRRGWIVNKINGTQVKEVESFDSFFDMEPGSMEFEFIDADMISHNITLTKELFILNATFNEQIISIDDKKTGYFAYQSFLKYSLEDLLIALNYFKSQSIEELIVDLRYNGGGYIDISKIFTEAIIPAGNEDKVFYTAHHNSARSSENDFSEYIASSELNLGLVRVFFIVNEYSASASELLINSLEPYMDVVTIGNTTAGKPYSMYGFEFQDWLAYPVTAKSVNADGYGDYDNGIIPDQVQEDNHYYDWGDLNDPSVAHAIHYIRYGNFDPVAITFKGTNTPSIIQKGNSFKRNLMIAN